MDVSQAIRNTENSLRDLIHEVMRLRYSNEWESELGVSGDRLQRWEQRREVEAKRQDGAAVEPRLLYYADFHDLWNILRKNWELFTPILGERKRIEVWMAELERLRDPNAHNRDLLPFQRQLAEGIAGDIRARIVRYRSKMETPEDYFPRIESIRDSAGNAWPASLRPSTRPLLRVGDELQLVITASDPLGGPLEYGYNWHPSGNCEWSATNALVIPIQENHIGKLKELHLRIRSPRQHHAYHGYDDFKIFHFDVLPK
ncbi:MAG: Swt1 family HEPN domain-containing protein [Halopseudomonas sp.]|uniref:Swt1 family HEPN domain-containing protein n=1 Tax=Halopseudomonas sp. TaxID=2901191 RepID=UPI003002CD1A